MRAIQHAIAAKQYDRSPPMSDKWLADCTLLGTAEVRDESKRGS